MTLAQLNRLMQLDEGPRHVLVVEDALIHYDAIIRWLEASGHHVTAFAEMHSLEEGRFSGLNLQGKPVWADGVTFQAAFLDFYFPRMEWNGGRVAQALIMLNPHVRIFGMSSVADKNRAMTRQGAVGAMLKRDLGALIR